MRYRPLGRTGLTVSEYCLGAMMFGPMGNPDVDDCVKMVSTALDAGINFIDTADVYSHGESERIVAKALRGRREDVVLATKFFAPMPGEGDKRNRHGASRRWITQAVEDSLRRLETDYIDVYQQHRFDAATDQEESLAALTDLVRAGKVRVIGSSSFAAERIVEAQWVSERAGLARYRTEQPPYSLFRRGIERAVLPTCRRYGMGTLIWSPLDGGWLSGRYRSEADFTQDTRLVRMASRWGGFDPTAEINRRKLGLVQAVTKLAEDAGLRLSHLATAFTVTHPDVTSAIIGPRTMEQLDDTLAGVDVRLDSDVLDALDALLPPGTDINQHDPSSDPAELAAAYRRGA